MKKIIPLLLLTILCTFASSSAWAQASLFVYKNPQTGEGDFMVVYGVPSDADAKFMAQEKLIELGYAEELIREQESTNSKGFGLIIKSVFQNRYGKSITVFGGALGCKTKEQAEKEAIANLKRYNPEWEDGTPFVAVQQFIDQ